MCVFLLDVLHNCYFDILSEVENENRSFRVSGSKKNQLSGNKLMFCYPGTNLFCGFSGIGLRDPSPLIG